MNKKTTSRTGMVKYALLVPLFAALLFVNNMQASEKTGNETQGTIKKEEMKAAKSQEQLSIVHQEPEKSQTPPYSPIKKDESVKSGVYETVEEMPRYPGGVEEMVKFLSQNIKYPDDAAKNGTEGTVLCRFIVTSTGEIANAVIVRSVDPALDTEALRAVNAMPNWEPGKQDGKFVSVYFTLPVKFSLPKENKREGLKVQTSQDPKATIYSVDGKVVSEKEFKSVDTNKIDRVDVDKENYPSGKISITTVKK